MIRHLELLVEEPSMEIAFRAILPRVLGDTSFEVHSFSCKNALLKRLPARLAGYSAWLPDDWAIIVLVDRDDGDCFALKRKLESIAARAGLRTRSAGYGVRAQVVSRVVVEELEAWFFGDWDAVRAAYPKASANVPRLRGYRNPDAVAGGTWEALGRLLRRAGYFGGGLRKLEAAREIASRMAPEHNRSASFQVFRTALLDMVAATPDPEATPIQ
jgi:hypothetical protein